MTYRTFRCAEEHPSIHNDDPGWVVIHEKATDTREADGSVTWKCPTCGHSWNTKEWFDVL